MDYIKILCTLKWCIRLQHVKHAGKSPQSLFTNLTRTLFTHVATNPHTRSKKGIVWHLWTSNHCRYSVCIWHTTKNKYMVWKMRKYNMAQCAYMMNTRDCVWSWPKYPKCQQNIRQYRPHKVQLRNVLIVLLHWCKINYLKVNKSNVFFVKVLCRNMLPMKLCPLPVSPSMSGMLTLGLNRVKLNTICSDVAMPCRWIKQPFDLLSFDGLASLVFCGCFFASSAAPFPAATAPALLAATGAAAAAAAAAAFFFFPPIKSPKHGLSAIPLRPLYEAKSSVKSREVIVSLKSKEHADSGVTSYSCQVTFWPHAATVRRERSDLVLHFGKCALNNHGRRIWRRLVQRVWRWTTNYHEQNDTSLSGPWIRVK